jgi:hypothetical protein
MTGIFYLFPNRPTKNKRPLCWCHARAAYACEDGFARKPENLCAVHALEWAEKRALRLPEPPPEAA